MGGSLAPTHAGIERVDKTYLSELYISRISAGVSTLW